MAKDKETVLTTVWQMLDMMAIETGDPDAREAVVVKLGSGGRTFGVTLLGPKGMTTHETVNALRAAAQFVADQVNVKLGGVRRATLEEFDVPPKGEIN